MTQAFNLAQLANNLNTSGQIDATDGLFGVVPLANGGTGGLLPVANGGTGRNTLTANNVILGNGTSTVQFVAPSTSGNLLTSNGSTWVSQAIGILGVGQLWQDVTTARAFDVTYTNSTGKPIQVIVCATGATFTDSELYLTVSSVLVNKVFVGGQSEGGIGNSVTAIVPNGATYIVTKNDPYAFNLWAELR
jgi:hypothetical protein